MLDRIIGFSIHNRLVIVISLFVWVGAGIWAFNRLPIDAVPDITNNQVQVITVCPDLAAEEVEQQVSFVLESGLKNIQGVEDIRSISRFGLSVVTLVFDESIDVYWARTRIAEKLSEIREEIPPSAGSPFLAPVSSGLGEIFQYTLETENPEDTTWSSSNLRTLQDWTVRRALLGVKGVADVSSFGGFVKTYQVSPDPKAMIQFGITWEELGQALSAGNQNTGGGYIENDNQIYYLRGMGKVTSIEEIKEILIKKSGEVPVPIKAIASVSQGHLLRYGALTKDGKKEAVGGIVLMIKGENSSSVIERVKARITEIETQLPKGVKIEPFLDRETLVQKAIHTVSKNLIEGGIIVILILVLFLGNLRSGLLVASVIPLSLLFAIFMMVITGVSGNLMSLGALDFGLIVDGAVIIVENVLHLFHQNKPKDSEGRIFWVKKGAGEMLHSAAFGQLIILIVYLPLLALTGVEGKMFRPMALTVAYALLGALILSFTYVPCMSAWVLRSPTSTKISRIELFINRLNQSWIRLLKLALRKPIWFLAPSLILLVITVGIFQNMGGEFIPKLDEGDYAIETRLPPGSSLTQSVNLSLQIESQLLKAFPSEIKSVVAKIGSSEIPTDPMPIEAMDLIVTLYPEDQWTRISSKEELTEAIEQELEKYVGIGFSIQQPIEMRFNELMSGAKSDVVVRLYGPDIQTLSHTGQSIATLIKDIPGAQDVQVQQSAGLPQLEIKYIPTKLAQYGITAEEVGTTLNIAYAGKTFGTLYEKEIPVPITLMLNNQNRMDLQALRTLPIITNHHQSIPLQELAAIDLIHAPAEISRENGRRRLNISLNVRGRDMESLVNEMRTKLKAELILPEGYHYTFGGRFENLVSARNRLAWVIPIALGIILLLLYLSFGRMQEGLLIFSAIPMAAVGGILSLVIRDMPFSISAGVGLIALSGVAVLNGIVLISRFKQLEKQGMTNIKRILLTGVSSRFRPVIMTALVASLGFLPMAISTGSGAEVQKPLATVVIGGLITATLLTLLLLPLLYGILKGLYRKSRTKINLVVPLFLLFCISSQVYAQPYMTEGQMVKKILEKHPQYLAAIEKGKAAKELIPMGKSLPATDFILEAPTGEFYTPGITQSLAWPGTYRNHTRFLSAGANVEASAILETRIILERQFKGLWAEWLYWQAIADLSTHQDSIWKQIEKIGQIRFQQGEISALEKLNAEAIAQAGLQYSQQNRRKLSEIITRLEWLSGESPNTWKISDSIVPPDLPPKIQSITKDTMLENHPLLGVFKSTVEQNRIAISMAKTQRLPGFQAGWLNQGTRQTPAYLQFRAGISIPLDYRSARAQIRSAKATFASSQQNLKAKTLEWQTFWLESQTHLDQEINNLVYFRKIALPQAIELERTALLAYRLGENNTTACLESLRQAQKIRESWLLACLNYRQALLDLSLFNY